MRRPEPVERPVVTSRSAAAALTLAVVAAAVVGVVGVVAGGPARGSEMVRCDQTGTIVSIDVVGATAVELSGVGGTLVVASGGATVCSRPFDGLTAIIVAAPGPGAAIAAPVSAAGIPPIAFSLGGTGTLSLTGTDGDDTLSFGTRFSGGTTVARTTVAAGAGDDRIDATGWDGAVVVSGGEGDDRLIGGSGDDRLAGGPGADTLEGGPGADALDGGDGTDRADYARSPAGVAVSLGGSASAAGGDAAGDVLRDLEDVLGSPGADVLRGDEGANLLLGGAGDDLLDGRGGADVLSGGFGTDTASYASSPGPVVATLGAQTGNAGGDAEGDVLVGLERLVGSRSGDVLTGDEGRNRLVGGGGDDVLDGTGGADTLLGGPGDDLLIGGTGRDTVSYAGIATGVSVDLTVGIGSGQGSDRLFEVESAIGGRSADLLVGSGGADRLDGGPGPDILRGRGGPDVLDGGPDGDLLDGGPGQDRCDPGTGDDRVLAC